MSTTPSRRPRPFVLIIMDGWGINPRKDGNAIALARTPNIDKLARRLAAYCGENLRPGRRSARGPDGKF